MLGRRKALTWMLGAGLCSALTHVATKGSMRNTALPRPQAWGYFPLWMKDSWRGLRLPVWDRVVLFELPVSSAGGIMLPHDWYREWHAMGEAIYVSGGSLDLAFTLMDTQKFEQLFSHKESCRRLLDTIQTEARHSGVGGVHLDFEPYGELSVRAVAGFRGFVADLSERLRSLAHHTILSVFFPIGTASELFDAQTLGHVDYVVVQGYDAHWVDSPKAGAVAPLRGSNALSWEKNLHYALGLGAARSKILFSIPYFGYEWPVASDQPGAATTGRGEIITYAPVEASLLPQIRVSAVERISHYPARRDPDSGSPYYVFQSPAGQWRQGWFEDQISLAEKYDFIIRERLCGIAAFPLGYDSSSFDALVQKKFGARGNSHTAK
ncbi:MAG: glycosyl hydrolase family 18 protein [Burkholderiaceae bacterium]